MKIIKYALFILVLHNVAFAACNPKDDPCAPKKELDSWINSLAFGFNFTQGNSKTTLLTVLGESGKETAQDKLLFKAAVNYGTDKAQKDVTGEDKTRSDVRASAVYDYKFTEDYFAGFTTDFFRDEIAEIDYRVTVGPDVGYYFIKNDDFKLAGRVGPGYLFEKVDGVEDDYFAPKVGDSFEWIISCTSRIYQNATVIYDVNNSDNYIVNADAGIETAISTSLSLVVGIRNIYDNEPAVGKDKNDILGITALKVKI